MKIIYYPDGRTKRIYLTDSKVLNGIVEYYPDGTVDDENTEINPKNSSLRSKLGFHRIESPHFSSKDPKALRTHFHEIKYSKRHIPLFDKDQIEYKLTETNVERLEEMNKQQIRSLIYQSKKIDDRAIKQQQMRPYRRKKR